MGQNNLYLLVCMILVGCVAPRPQFNYNTQEIGTLSYVTPYSYMELIEHGNRGFYNDSISQTMQTNIEDYYSEKKDAFHLTNKISFNDTAKKKIYIRSLVKLVRAFNLSKRPDTLKIGTDMLNLLIADSSRYVLLTVNRGFTRTEKNADNQTAKNGVIAVLSLGSYIQISYRGNSTVYLFILDKLENRLIFGKKTFVQDIDPMEKRVPQGQIHSLIQDFWAKKF